VGGVRTGSVGARGEYITVRLTQVPLGQFPFDCNGRHLYDKARSGSCGARGVDSAYDTAPLSRACPARAVVNGSQGRDSKLRPAHSRDNKTAATHHTAQLRPRGQLVVALYSHHHPCHCYLRVLHCPSSTQDRHLERCLLLHHRSRSVLLLATI